MKRVLIYLLAIVVTFSFLSCGKDGIVGPEGKAGDKGQQGEKGDPGVANISSSDWIKFDWSTYNGTSNVFDIGYPIAKEVMDKVIDGGVMLVYFQLDPYWHGSLDYHAFTFMLPYVSKYTPNKSTSIESITFSLERYKNTSELRIFLGCGTPYFGAAEQRFIDRFRYVVIPKGMPISKTNPKLSLTNLKKMTYSEAKGLLNLKD